MLTLPLVYPITDRDLSGLSHTEQVRALTDARCHFVQIREKKGTSNAFYEAVIESLEVAKGLDVKIIVNDRVDIAIATGADGVHLGQDDLPPEQARKLLGDHAIIGLSTHSVEQAIAAAKMPIDYAAIGPIFGTRTKKNPDPVVGLDGLRRVRDAVADLPLVAIGGINLSNIAEVINAGADSAAVISDLFVRPTDIGGRYDALFRAASVKRG